MSFTVMRYRSHKPVRYKTFKAFSEAKAKSIGSSFATYVVDKSTGRTVFRNKHDLSYASGIPVEDTERLMDYCSLLRGESIEIEVWA